jgi:hypothetical protein
MTRRFWTTVLIVFVPMGIVGIGIAILFARWSTEPDDLQSTISKAGVGVALTTIAAAVGAIALRIIDFQRVRDDERRRLHRSVVEAYNSVKAVRRRLVALGLDRAVSSISDEHWKEMKGAIDELNTAQLCLEAIKREVDLTDALARRDEVSRALAIVEKYINEEVLEQWEEHGWSDWKVRKRACPEIDVSRFVEKKYFRHNVSNQLDLITSVLQRELGRR